MNESFRAGFVAIVGRPNSGKSTLLNSVLNEELALVSSVPQTTRTLFKGIYTSDSVQIIFVDTPGIHNGKYELNKAILEETLSVFCDKGIDLFAYVVDINDDFGEEEDFCAKLSKKHIDKTVIVFNKIDLCKTPDIKVEEFFKRYNFLKDVPYIMLSAILPSAGKEFVDFISNKLPVNPPYYDSEYLTDKNLRYFVSEYIRKAIIKHTKKEVPHAVYIEVLDYKEKESKDQVEVNIHVETKGQKGIIIGKNGTLIRTIMKEASHDMKKLTGKDVHINCHVKVTPNWRNNTHFLNEMGFYTKKR